LFFVDLPNTAERAKIFEVHITKRGRDASKYRLDTMAKISDGYSGAEIESCVTDALFTAFDAETELSDKHIIDAINAVVPLSEMSREKIAKIREWSKGRARLASTPENEPKTNRAQAIEM
jgi:SpoVK/Ycf46/Vps4 family AAA+-type ATPase